MPSIKPLHWKKLVYIFEKVGYIHVRTKGDHMSFDRAESQKPVVIPKYDEIPVFIIKKNMKTANLSNEEFFRLLEDC